MNRNQNIDNLRGLAMFSMIIIHATAYFLSNKITYYIWDFAQWAVPVFLFCSAYLFYSRPFEFNLVTLKKYFKKRFLRLFVPYFIFLAVYTFLIYFFEPHKFNNINYLLGNVFLYGGLDLNWLVLLFLQLAIIFPFLRYFKEKKSWVYYLYVGLALISSIFYTFNRPANYRIVMWAPWSLIAMFTIFFIDAKENWKKLTVAGFLSGAVFLISYLLEMKIGHTLNHYSNKYPPNLYHLSYGIFFIIVLFYLSKSGIFKIIFFDRLLNFLSINSYELFFIHNLVIFLLTWLKFKFANWMVFFLVIIVISLLIQFSLNKIRSYFVKKAFVM